MTAEDDVRVPPAQSRNESLRERCSIVEPGIVLLREIPEGTAEALRVMNERARELGRPFGRYALVVDLTEVTTRPKGEYLRVIRHVVTDPVHTALTQPGNAFMRGVLRFVMARISDRASVHASLDEATARARSALQPPHEAR